MHMDDLLIIHGLFSLIGFVCERGGGGMLNFVINVFILTVSLHCQLLALITTVVGVPLG